jgi:hypothetical protein
MGLTLGPSLKNPSLTSHLRHNQKMRPPPHFFGFLVLVTSGTGYSADASAVPNAVDLPRPSSSGIVSPGISAAIRAHLPTYTAPTQKALQMPATQSTETVTMLSKMVVTGSKPNVPKFSEWELLTKSGQSSYLKKRYTGATPSGDDPLTEKVPNYAAQMLRDDTRQETIKKLEEVSELYRLNRDSEGDQLLRKEIQRSLMRRSDWRTEGMDKAYNNGRR